MKDIEVEAVAVKENTAANPNTNTALARIESGAVGRPMALEEIGERLKFIRSVMADVMKEGQDYGKIPGCGDKPGLFQPGAQKLLMAFNLREQVKTEVIREINLLGLPPGHREYEFIVTVFPSGQDPRNGWDGVGTCSTMESKYRYRGSKRKCPKCGAEAIIKGKREYGGGWICFDKKGGCKAKFSDTDPTIVSQTEKPEENLNPADGWNTVRKMAFKRALVAASINATNTSELWTQDLEDIAGNQRARQQPGSTDDEADFENLPPANARRGSTSATQPGQANTPKTTANAPEGNQAPAKRPSNGTKPDSNMDIMPSEKFRTRAIEALQAGLGQPGRRLVEDFLRKAGAVLPDVETVENWPLEYVPATADQLAQLRKAVADFENGEEAHMPFIHKTAVELDDKAEKPKPAKKVEAAPTKTAPVEVPRGEEMDPHSPSAPWRSFKVPFGKHQGTTLAELDKKVLYGFCMNFKVDTEWQGRPRPPEKIASEKVFRAMLDHAAIHYEFEEK